MKRSAFTLLEMIFVIVVSAILSVGTFKAVEALYIRSAKAKAVTEMTLRSQIVLDELGVLLYNRIQNTIIGYKAGESFCTALIDLTDSKPIIEWFGTLDDKLLQRKYDGFIDMHGSTKPTLKTPYMDKNFNDTDVDLIFSGTFDSGKSDQKACKGAFGWHGNDSNSSYSIDVIDENQTKLTDSNSLPQEIYEKYYLTHSAFALARGEALDKNDLKANCANYTEIEDEDFNNTLFLFYDYRPYNDGDGTKDRTFCGDSQGTREGNVSIIAQDVTAFNINYKNDVLKISIDMERKIKGSTKVHVYKQKVVF